MCDGVEQEPAPWRQSSASTDSMAVDGVVIGQFGLRLYERLLRRRESEEAG